MVGTSTKGAGGGIGLGNVWFASRVGSSLLQQLGSTGPETWRKHMVLEKEWARRTQTRVYILFHRLGAVTVAKIPAFVTRSLLTYKVGANMATSQCCEGYPHAGLKREASIHLLALIPNTSISLGPDPADVFNKCMLKEWMNKVLYVGGFFLSIFLL